MGAVEIILKILMLIDSFSSGGAQRQFCYLANEMHMRGKSVTIICYNSYSNHFREELDLKAIEIIEYPFNNGVLNKIRKIFAIRRIIRSRHFDSIVSFQTGANILAGLVIMPFGRPRLIVCERGSRFAPQTFGRKAFLYLSFLLAEKIVTNSYDRKLGISAIFNGKTSIIRNGYPTVENVDPATRDLGNVSSIAIIGRLDAVKNPLKIIRAFELFYDVHGNIPEINWFGRYEDIDDITLRDEVFERIARNEIFDNKWKWRGVVRRISKVYQENDCILHVSLHEGTPNVVCEAMLHGCPVIASNVCDNPLIIEDGKDGILCSPLDENSIFEALDKIVKINLDAKRAMILRAFQKAKEEFSLKRMADKFEAVILDG